ncbi:MAG: hypothetical protein OQK24_14300, partial [Magnetovibrio sp.]|nr:hypothetical protein [Magnetovibrio sp.]
ELGPKWSSFAAVWTSGMAYTVSVGFYQAATFDRHPATSAAWLSGLALIFAGVVLVMYRKGRFDYNPALDGAH